MFAKLRSTRSTLHAHAELVIPWLANESLPAEAEPAARQHIASCLECREDLEDQQLVCAATRADSPLVFAAVSSFQKLLARIQNPQIGRRLRGAALRRSKVSHPFWWTALKKQLAALRWLGRRSVVR
ncbi:MAG: hypothetical protein WAM21_00990 [Steroidobacteraceae bacterium]